MLLDIFRMPSKVTKPTSQVYTSYDTTNPPKHPGHGWTRFVCISDTHSKECFVPPGDILLHSGDLSSWGYPDQLEKTLEWLESLPHPAKMYVVLSPLCPCLLTIPRTELSRETMMSVRRLTSWTAVD